MAGRSRRTRAVRQPLELLAFPITDNHQLVSTDLTRVGLLQSQNVSGLIPPGDMERKIAPEQFAVGVQGHAGVVVFLGEMAEAGPLQAIGGGPDEFGCFAIGKMSPGSADPLFQMLRIRAVLQHLFIVIAFDDHRIERLQDLPQACKRVAEIRQNPQSVLAIFDHVGHPIGSIVRGGYGVNGDLFELERVSRVEVADIRQASEFAPAMNRAKRRFGNVDREAEFALVNPHALGMVAVIVGNQKSLGGADVFPFFAEPIFGRTPADSGVDHKADIARLDKVAVAIAAGLKGNDFHGFALPGAEDWEKKTVSGKIDGIQARYSPPGRTTVDARF